MRGKSLLNENAIIILSLNQSGNYSWVGGFLGGLNLPENGA